MGLPLFGRGKKETNEPSESTHSIKSVPRWEEATAFLGTRFGVEYEVAVVPSLFSLVRSHSVEVARDKGNVTMLLPGSEATHAESNLMERFRLDELDSGDSTVELRSVPVGTPLVGRNKTTVKRAYVDGFVSCMTSVFHIPWEQVHALTHRKRAFPMFLVAGGLMFAIAPVLGESVGKTVRYHPEMAK